MSKVKEQNYVVIQGWMLSKLQLKGNDLLIYAIIYGFSQNADCKFTGSLQYLADWTNSTKQGVLNSLKSLLNKKLITKKDYIINGVKFVEYYSNDFNEVVKKVEQGYSNNFNGGGQESLHNNTNDKLIDNSINNKEKINKKEIPTTKESLTTQKQYFSKEFQEWYECYTEPQKTIDWNKPSISKEKLQKKFNQAVEDIGLDELMEKTKYYLLFKKYETSGTAKMFVEVFLNGKYGEDYKAKYEVVCKKQGKPLPVAQKTPEKQQEEVKIKEDAQKKREGVIRHLHGEEVQFMNHIKEVLKTHFDVKFHRGWIDDLLFSCRNKIAYFNFTQQKYIEILSDVQRWQKFTQCVMQEITTFEGLNAGKIELKLID